jgi:ribosomal-protein-alanine N-acetyltransferase
MTAADLDRVIEIAQNLKQAPHWPRSVYLAALDRLAVPRRIALVAEAMGTGAVAGFAVACLLVGTAPLEAELETIAVAANFQRRGVARQLFQALAGELRSAKATAVILEVRTSNTAAQALYRSLGFVEAGRRPRYYADPVEDAVLMRLRG